MYREKNVTEKNVSGKNVSEKIWMENKFVKIS